MRPSLPGRRCGGCQIPTDTLIEAVWLSLLAGSAILLGGSLAAVERIRPNWLERELHHTVTAIGGGALLAAVALVLVPHGLGTAPLWATMTAFFAGGLTALAMDVALSRGGGTLSQLAAMLLDFIPETIVIGAIIARDRSEALLLALIIFVQNVPESFTAFREIRESKRTRPVKLLVAFGVIGASGPLYMLLGAVLLADHDMWLGLLTIFCGGGILYLVFRDVAPQAKLENRFFPQMGALIGFAIGMIGEQIAG